MALLRDWKPDEYCILCILIEYKQNMMIDQPSGDVAVRINMDHHAR
jgi:hypothetical protein